MGSPEWYFGSQIVTSLMFSNTVAILMFLPLEIFLATQLALDMSRGP